VAPLLCCFASPFGKKGIAKIKLASYYDLEPTRLSSEIAEPLCKHDIVFRYLEARPF
jgi:hypothetical protein